MTYSKLPRANSSEYSIREGIRGALHPIEQYKAWHYTEIGRWRRPAGFATAKSGLGFADATSAKGHVRTIVDARTTDEVEAIAGKKPDGLSWRDFGEIFARAYAAGGRDALVLERAEHCEYLIRQLERIGATQEQVDEIVSHTFTTLLPLH